MNALTKAAITILVLLGAGVLAWQVMTKKPAPETPPAPAPDAAVGPSIQRIRTRGELLVGMDVGMEVGSPGWNGTPPMLYPNANQTPDGFDYRLAQAVADAVGVKKVTIVPAEAPNAYERLPGMLTDAKSVDLVISGYSETTLPGVAWSDPYLEYGLCLVVPSKSQIKTVADLWGKKVGIFNDDAAAAEVGRLVKGHAGIVRREQDYWDDLLKGVYAGFIYDYPYVPAEIEGYYEENPDRRGSLRIAQFNLTASTYNVAVRADEKDLLAAVNDGIRAFRRPDNYDEVVKKYLTDPNQAETTTAEAGENSYVIQPGDTLSGIARTKLGDAGKWTVLWELNKSRFAHPSLIFPGQPLALP